VEARVSEAAQTASAIMVIAGRIAAGKHEVAERVVDRFRDEIADYHIVDDPSVLADVFSLALESLEMLTAGLQNGGEEVATRQLERVRDAGRRRVHQRVSLESALHAGRVWARVVWDAVLEETHIDRPEEREAALTIAGRLLRHTDLISTVVTGGYLDELSSRGLVRHDLLDAIIAGHGDSEIARRRAGALGVRLGENYVVVVIRAPEAHAEEPRQQPRAAQAVLDCVVQATRAQLRPADGGLIVGMRHGDVVALYPVAEPAEVDNVRRESAALLDALGIDVAVGMSGWHAGLSAITSAYEEALDAADIALASGIRGRAVALDEVLVDHILRSSSHADRILGETLRPVIEYDRAHSASLIATLRAYLDTRLNLTRTAKVLSVHPNTIVYRLRRITELSGRDPRSPEDLLVLSLAVKFEELRAPR
jgi:sugar diacid utilization regulator